MPELDSYIAPARPIGLSWVDTAPGALGRLADLLRRLSPPPLPTDLVVLGDTVPKSFRGADLNATVVGLCESVGDVRQVTVATTAGRTHADARTLGEATDASYGASLLVSVGSGTLTDIAKEVAARLGVRSHVAVQTALSVNGYADDRSVLEIEGVKRTVRSRWPDALVADPTVLAEAPAALNVAGVGDLLAMFTAPADWQLAAALGMDDSFAEEPVAMVRDHADALLQAASHLPRRETMAIELVARVLALSGISMGLAGTTAPASGAEHTISHLLDMAAARDGRISALHGTQVGVAAVVVSLVWRKVLAIVRSGRTQLQAPTEDEVHDDVRASFGFLDDSGAAAEECWRDCRRKVARWRVVHGDSCVLNPAALEAPALLLEAPEVLVDALRSAGSPTRFSELDPPVAADRARWALANCHLFRDRFTIVDLAQLLGVWGPDSADEVLEEAAALGAGL